MLDWAELHWMGPVAMQITVNIEYDLLAKARQVTGIHERNALLRAGLIALIERESARRLAAMGGTEKLLENSSRRRPSF